MEKAFAILFDYAKRLRSRYLNTLAAFKIFERFSRLSAINIVGKRKAEKNTKIFNSYRYFFAITKESAKCYFLIELAKFFDNCGESLTVYSVISYAEKNVAKLTKQDFLNFHRDRQILPELFARYKQLSLSDLKKIKDRIKRNEHLIKNLKIYRDKYLAHDDIIKKQVGINNKEIKVLFNIVKSVIALLYNKLDFSVISYVNFEKEPIEDLNRLMENLIKCEQLRLDEIRKKWLKKNMEIK